MIVGAVPSLEVPALQLLLKSQQVKGWYSGTSIDSQETLAFSVLSGVRSMNESFPLEQVNEAYERMVKARPGFGWFSPWASSSRSAFLLGGAVYGRVCGFLNGKLDEVRWSTVMTR